jgi:hypothetical protein
VGSMRKVDGSKCDCGIIRYWPAPVDCSQATVTEVFCGGTYQIGETNWLPQLDDDVVACDSGSG